MGQQREESEQVSFLEQFCVDLVIYLPRHPIKRFDSFFCSILPTAELFPRENVGQAG